MKTPAVELGYLRALVRERAAIIIEPNKDYLIEARLGPLARETGFASIADLINGLRPPRTPQTSSLEKRVIEAMTTNETLFFRDAHPFNVLEKRIIPELLQKRTSKALTVWSAACSTGQEAYSISMLLEESFPQLRGWNVRIFATDIAENILEYARRARYRQIEVNRGLPAPLLLKYFERDGGDYCLKEQVKHRVHFQLLNLIERWPPLPQMDVVFLRNVLIYFDLETKRAILDRVKRVLARDGVLFLGAAETTLTIDPSFERVQEGKAVFYRLQG